MRQWLELLVYGPPLSSAPELLRDDHRIAPEFRESYQRDIVPNLIAFETKRVEALANIRKRMLLAVPASLLIILTEVAVLLFVSHSSDALEFTLQGGGLLLVLLWGWVWFAQTQYHNSVREEIFPHIFRHFGESFRYNASGGMNLDDLAPFDILPKYSTHDQSDYVAGSYRDIPLDLEKLKLVHGSGKNRTTTFDGLVVRLTVLKSFKGKTLIRRDAGKVGNWFQKRASLDRVHLEDPEFEAKYEVFSSDQIEARYLLTTSFMERLMELETLLGSALQASFHNGQLLILMPSKKDWFVPASLHQPATFIDDIALVMEQMQLLFKIIEVLRLDENTGL